MGQSIGVADLIIQDACQMVIIEQHIDNISNNDRRRVPGRLSYFDGFVEPYQDFISYGGYPEADIRNKLII
jgi:hypothetical protein